MDTKGVPPLEALLESSYRGAAQRNDGSNAGSSVVGCRIALAGQSFLCPHARTCGCVGPACRSGELLCHGSRTGGEAESADRKDENCDDHFNQCESAPVSHDRSYPVPAFCSTSQSPTYHRFPAV